MVPPPVKVRAEELGLRVLQPESKADLGTTLNDLAPFDVGVVVAYGRILTEPMLDVPGSGFLNVHFSLLPRWRGAAPVARAIMAGDMMSGVTIIRLEKGLDTGPVLTAQAVDILPDENAGQLTDRLAKLGARLVVAVLPGYLEGSVTATIQSDEGATYANKLLRDDRLLDQFAQPDEFINRVRALAPTPGATLVVDQTLHKILGAARASVDVGRGRWREFDGALVLGVTDGTVEVTELQPEGKRRMSAADWLRGRRKSSGEFHG
jgi:methionyl-tRNA formyltransferase